MKRKKVVIVTNSSSYEPRAEKIGKFFEAWDCDVQWLESDFIHREKKKGRNALKNHIYVDTISYKRNLSIRRLYSHYDFSRKVFKMLEKQQIDLLYVLLPANSLAPFAVRLKQLHHARLVFDVIDLWPESLRLKQAERFWPFQYWRRLRDDYLQSADLLLTECNLYQKKLKNQPEHTVTMYWHKEMQAREVDFRADKCCLHIAYLGSINNIIDIDTIVKILSAVNRSRKVLLHVVGDGENRETLLQKLRENQIEALYHGAVYEEEKKEDIFSRCSFGINLMKPGVCVGLTMKSIDYFCYGLPMINNIPGDTWELLEKYGIGVNCETGKEKECAEKILEKEQTMQEKRELIRKLYQDNFTVQAMEGVLSEYVLPLIQKGE